MIYGVQDVVGLRKFSARVRDNAHVVKYALDSPTEDLLHLFWYSISERLVGMSRLKQ